MFSLQISELLKEFIEQSRNILNDNLVSVYLHGSAVMGCFNNQKSDIDLIVVVNQPLVNSVKKEYMDMVIKYNDLAPEKGIETSIILRKFCDPFIYPTPYDLHFSKIHLERYKANPYKYVLNMNGEDIDLVAHITILKKRGICLYGLPI
ncbi:nucleotidyltransferase domain-containing protein [Facklamia miroungae]|uniref:Streptomycin 3-adenylyltransferase n=1 Tax=Facklamia miroungae TaxID=120956 RepID=A0A1G7UTR4_9LACT|nr:nucleotidyltransferase domain-containing protein [Facklamia miroungae]SDG50922.1 streptomycin 3-adenylyltransferase [Facklamia miroungae]